MTEKLRAKFVIENGRRKRPPRRSSRIMETTLVPTQLPSVSTCAKCGCDVQKDDDFNYCPRCGRRIVRRK